MRDFASARRSRLCGVEPEALVDVAVPTKPAKRAIVDAVERRPRRRLASAAAPSWPRGRRSVALPARRRCRRQSAWKWTRRLRPQDARGLNDAHRSRQPARLGPEGPHHERADERHRPASRARGGRRARRRIARRRCRSRARSSSALGERRHDRQRRREGPSSKVASSRAARRPCSARRRRAGSSTAPTSPTTASRGRIFHLAIASTTVQATVRLYASIVGRFVLANGLYLVTLDHSSAGLGQEPQHGVLRGQARRDQRRARGLADFQRGVRCPGCLGPEGARRLGGGRPRVARPARSTASTPRPPEDRVPPASGSGSLAARRTV